MMEEKTDRLMEHQHHLQFVKLSDMNAAVSLFSYKKFFFKADYSSHVGQGECRWSPCGFESNHSGFRER